MRHGFVQCRRPRLPASLSVDATQVGALVTCALLSSWSLPHGVCDAPLLQSAGDGVPLSCPEVRGLSLL